MDGKVVGYLVGMVKINEGDSDGAVEFDVGDNVDIIGL